MNAPLKILYLEDDELDQETLVRFVRQKNLPYDLTIAGSLAQARARLAETCFALILADYHLPDGQATALFGEVPDTPFILMTATLDEQLALCTLERGADDYLPKDFKYRYLEGLPLTVEKVLYRKDIFQRERTLTRAIREQDRRMRLAQQATGVGTFEWDIPNNRVTWSPELERLYGLPPGGFGGSYEAWAARVHLEDWPETERQYQRGLTTGHLEAEWRVIWPDGSVHWLAGRATVEMDAAGQPTRMLGVNIDITDRKQAEKALQESERHFRDIAEALSIMVWQSRADTLCDYFNQRWLQFTGRTSDQELGNGWAEGLHTDDRQRCLQTYHAAFARRQPFEMEYRLRHHSGEHRWIFDCGLPRFSPDGAFLGYIGGCIDLTERKRAERELAVVRDQLAADLAAMERLHKVSTRFAHQGDLQTLLDAILDAAIAITAASKGNVQLLNAASGELGIAAHRGFDPAFVKFFSHIRAGQVACGTAMQTRRCVIVEDITLSPLFLEEPRARQLKLAAGMRAITCTPLLTRSGEMVGVLSVHFPTPHRPTDRDLRLLDLLARQAADFIERTQAETALRAAKEELARANLDLEAKVQQRTAKLQEALTELEHISYSMIHDMRAPLRAMETFATFAEEACAGYARPQARDYFRRIHESTRRLDRLVTDALNYNKVVREELPTTPIDLGSLLRGLIHSYPNLDPSLADIHLDFHELYVLGNESLLTQAFGNLLGNAVKFVAPGVRPRVRLWAQPSTLNSQPSTLIFIQDNGIGIPKNAQEKIFRMFQRMHRESEYPGTGIGLPITRKAVERMGGRVGLESDPGHGSKFWVELLAPTQAQMHRIGHRRGVGRG